jgi:hypothetical protein
MGIPMNLLQDFAAEIPVKVKAMSDERILSTLRALKIAEDIFGRWPGARPAPDDLRLEMDWLYVEARFRRLIPPPSNQPERLCSLPLPKE